MGDGQRRPNVLVIQPDQHRGTIMGCAGDTQVQTPNLDMLAGEGIRFSHTASSSPVCSPFRGTMQTGLYPHTHGVVGNNILLDPELTSFAEVFAEAGYATGYIGKWHLDGGIPERGSGGFIAPGPRRQGWQEWHAHEKGHSFFDVWTFDDRGDKVHFEDYDWEPTWHTDMALDFARRHRDADTPWLFYLGYGPPHKPEQCPDRFLDMYDIDEFELPPDVQGRFSVAVYRGRRLVTSKTDARYVKGRHSAGGTSQKRFERIRQGQINRIYDKACQAVEAQLGPYADQLDYIVLGGESFTLIGFWKSCPFLLRHEKIIQGRRLNVRDPKRDTLEQVGDMVWESRVWPLALDW